MELVQLHEIEEVEGAKDKLTVGKVTVDYATGKVGRRGGETEPKWKEAKLNQTKPNKK